MKLACNERGDGVLNLRLYLTDEEVKRLKLFGGTSYKFTQGGDIVTIRPVRDNSGVTIGSSYYGGDIQQARHDARQNTIAEAFSATLVPKDAISWSDGKLSINLKGWNQKPRNVEAGEKPNPMHGPIDMPKQDIMETKVSRKTRQYQKASWDEIEPLLNLARNSLKMTDPEIARKIGVSPHSFSTWRNEGRGPAILPFALKGLLKDKVEGPSLTIGFRFTDEQLEILNTALAGMKLVHDEEQRLALNKLRSEVLLELSSRLADKRS